MKNKKGMSGIGDLVPFAIMLGVAVIIISLFATLLGDFQADQTSGDADYNVTADGLTSMQTLAQYLPTLALAGVIVLVIGFIIQFVVRRFIGGR